MTTTQTTLKAGFDATERPISHGPKIMRSGLTYLQAVANAKHVGMKAYEAVLANDGSIDEAEKACYHAYNSEMEWYES